MRGSRASGERMSLRVRFWRLVRAAQSDLRLTVPNGVPVDIFLAALPFEAWAIEKRATHFEFAVGASLKTWLHGPGAGPFLTVGVQKGSGDRGRTKCGFMAI